MDKTKIVIMFFIVYVFARRQLNEKESLILSYVRRNLSALLNEVLLDKV